MGRANIRALHRLFTPRRWWKSFKAPEVHLWQMCRSWWNLCKARLGGVQLWTMSRRCWTVWRVIFRKLRSWPWSVERELERMLMKLLGFHLEMYSIGFCGRKLLATFLLQQPPRLGGTGGHPLPPRQPQPLRPRPRLQPPLQLQPLRPLRPRRQRRLPLCILVQMVHMVATETLVFALRMDRASGDVSALQTMFAWPGVQIDTRGISARQ